jgi:hypothetical protein
LVNNGLWLLGVFSMLDQHLGIGRGKPERVSPNYTLRCTSNEHRFA